MKTKEQILEWLDKQPWKNEFYENCFKVGKNKIEYSEYFISRAFLYDDTPQGKYIWKERHIKYKEWYNSSDKPMSWEEYCETYPISNTDYYIDKNSRVYEYDCSVERDYKSDVNVMSKELCEAFLAYMKLIQLRNAWVECHVDSIMYYKIVGYSDKIRFYNVGYNAQGLSFPSREMAQEFLDTFKDLLETAKPLL